MPAKSESVQAVALALAQQNVAILTQSLAEANDKVQELLAKVKELTPPAPKVQKEAEVVPFTQ